MVYTLAMKHPNNRKIRDMRDQKRVKYKFPLLKCHIRRYPYFLNCFFKQRSYMVFKLEFRVTFYIPFSTDIDSLATNIAE